MTPEDLEKLMRSASASVDDLMRRPWECSELEAELRAAMESNDVASCRELLREKGNWLAKFRGHELAELMDAAIVSGESAVPLVDLLLQSGVPANCVRDHLGPDYQHTPLITAARLGRLDLAQRLAAAGADVFWRSPTGANALSEILPSRAVQAPCKDSPDLARVREWLTHQGLRIDPLCADSRRKLAWAAGQPESWPDIPALLELGIPPDVTGWTPFMLDMALGIAEVRAAEGLPTEELRHRDAWSRTPFLLAVSAGQLEMARGLFGRGSDLHARGHCGKTALHLAAGSGHCHLLEWLLAGGLPLDVRDDFSHSALHEAVSHGCLGATTLLLAKGADVHERDELGFALIHAVAFKDEDDLAILRQLLKSGAEVNDVSGGGDWPLRNACQSGNLAGVAFLLEVGAQPNLTSTGETALFSAVSRDDLECVRLLMDSGAEANAVDVDGWTCLFHLRSEPVARFLLEHGANPAIRDQCGGLPEDWKQVPRSVRQMLRDWRTGGGSR